MRWVYFAMFLGVALPALAEEQTITLKPGTGHDETVNNCAACHSLDYIPMNSPFLSPEQWKGEVNKMRKAFGAPIDDADAEKIINYLVTSYGAPASQ